MDNEEFESLDIEQQIKVFTESPIGQKADLILRSQEPGKLTRSLSAEELYLISREMDPDERSELVRHANMDQLFFIADIDCWKGDRIDPEGFVGWLETLRQADERRLFAWLYEVDYETVVAGLQKVVKVLKPTWEYAVDEVLGDSPYFTLDQMYYILVDEENFETVRRTFEILFENHRGRYTAILEGMLAEMEYEVEEDAHAFRESRLADRGFPDYETSMRAYVPMSLAEFESFEKKEPAGPQPAEGAVSRPNYPVLWQLKKIYLDRVLQQMHEEGEALDQVYEELAWLSNKIIVCNGMDFTSEEKVRWAVEKARSVLSLGLELLSGGSTDGAARIVRERWLETVFRYGIGRLFALRDEARKVVRRHWKSPEAFLAFLDSPYDFILRGLLEKVPLAYDYEFTENPYHLREFQSAADLQRAQQSLDQAAVILEFIGRADKAIFARAEEEHDVGGVQVTLTPVLGTFFARRVLAGKELSAVPLNRSEFKSFLKKAFQPDGGRLLLNEDVKADFLEENFSDREREKLLSMWGLVFQRLQEQIGPLDQESPEETFLVSALLFKPEKAPSPKPAGKRRPKA